MPHAAKVIDQYLRKDKATGIYKAVFRDRDGKIRERTTKTKDREKARQAVVDSKWIEIDRAARANALTAEVITGITAGGKITCEAAIEEWAGWRIQFSALNTVRTLQTILRQFCREPGIEKSPVAAITFEAINRFVNAEDAGKLSNRYQRLAALKSLFIYLTAKAYYVGNPTKLVTVRYSAMTHEEKEPTERVPFTDSEVNLILKAIASRMKDLEDKPNSRRFVTQLHYLRFFKWATALSYWAGLRLTDICCLEWSGILEKEIVVWTRKADQRVALPIKDPLIGGGKLAPILLEIMMEHNVHPRYVFPEEAALALDPTKRSRLSVYYARLLEDVGIEGKSFHCLRHAFATRLDRAGKTVEEIGRLLGHAPSSDEITKGYIHRKK